MKHYTVAYTGLNVVFYSSYTTAKQQLIKEFILTFFKPNVIVSNRVPCLLLGTNLLTHQRQRTNELPPRQVKSLTAFFSAA